MAIAELTVDEFKEKQKKAEEREAKKIKEFNLKTKCKYCDDYHEYSEKECFEKISIYPEILYIETTVPEIGSWSDPHANWFCYAENNQWREENTTESYRKQKTDLLFNRDENGRMQDLIYSLQKNLVSVYFTFGTEHKDVLSEKNIERHKHDGEQVKIVLWMSDENIKKIREESYHKRPVSRFLIGTLCWMMSDKENGYYHTGNKPLANTRFMKKLNQHLNTIFYWEVLPGFDTLFCRKRKFVSSSNHDVRDLKYAIEFSKNWSKEPEEKTQVKEVWRLPEITNKLKKEKQAKENFELGFHPGEIIRSGDDSYEYWSDCQDELGHITVWCIDDEILPLDHVLFEGENLIVEHEYHDDWEEFRNFPITAIAKNGTIAEVWRAIDKCHHRLVSRNGYIDHRYIESISIGGNKIYYHTGS